MPRFVKIIIYFLYSWDCLSNDSRKYDDMLYLCIFIHNVHVPDRKKSLIMDPLSRKIIIWLYNTSDLVSNLPLLYFLPPRNECFGLYHPVCTMSAALPPFIIFFRVRLGLEGLCGEGVSVLLPRISGNISTGMPLVSFQWILRNISIELPLVRPYNGASPPSPPWKKCPRRVQICLSWFVHSFLLFGSF
jgi:hypothetical protein